MKRLLITLSMAAALLFPAAAGAMDAKTLLENPERYRVVETAANSVIYVDTESLMGIETADLPSSLQNIYCTLYVMDIAVRPTAADYQENKLTTGILEYDAHIWSDKTRGKYKILSSTLKGAFDADGKASENNRPLKIKSAKGLFHRLFMVDASKRYTLSEK